VIFLVILSFLSIAPVAIGADYDRDAFYYRSYKPDTVLGTYTGQSCDSVNIDHVVSLKDAFESGAKYWSDSRRAVFANDRDNHLPSCSSVNSSKGSAGPKDFLRRSQDGRGLEYQIVDFCGYVVIYHTVKKKYGLSFKSNDAALFQRCGLQIDS
jgi:hypothetical protein